MKIWFYLYEVSRVVKLIETKSRMVNVRGCAEAKARSCLMSVVSFLEDEKVLEIGCTAMSIYLTLLNYILKMGKIVNFM